MNMMSASSTSCPTLRPSYFTTLMEFGLTICIICARSAVIASCTRNTESPAAEEPEQAPMMPATSPTIIANDPQVAKVPDPKPVLDMIEVKLKSVSRNAGSHAMSVVEMRQSQTIATAPPSQRR